MTPRPWLYYGRECTRRAPSAASEYAELLGAIDGAAVGVRQLRRAPHEQRAEHGVSQAPQVLGEVPPVGDGIARGVVDEGTELGGGQAPVGRQDLGLVVV